MQAERTGGDCLRTTAGDEAEKKAATVISVSVLAAISASKVFLSSCTPRCLSNEPSEHLCAAQVRRKLIFALVLAMIFMVVEVVGGFIANRCITAFA